MRRSPGDGQVVKRGDRYEIRYSYNGRLHTRTSRTWRTRRQAEAALTAFRTEITEGATRRSDPASQDVATWMRRWLQEIVIGPETPRTTIATYTSHIERRIVPNLGHIPLRDLTPALIQQCLAYLLTLPDGSPNYAPKTVRDCRTVLVAALNAAVDLEILTRNPAARVHGPRVPRAPERLLSVEDARRLLALFEGTREQLPVTVGLLYGLRISEALGLRWRDVDESGVHVRGQLDPYTQQYRPRLKAGETRDYPVIPIVAQALAHARTYGGREFCTVTPRGTPIRQSVYRERFVRLTKRAGFGHLTPHDLRHGTASLLVVMGVHPRVAMQAVGHASAAMHQHYQSVPPALVTDALLRLDDAIRGGTS